MANLILGKSSAAGTDFVQGLVDSPAYAVLTGQSWAELESGIAQRYAQGRGREYGLNIGHSLIASEPTVNFTAPAYYTAQHKLIRNDKTTRNEILATQLNLV